MVYDQWPGRSITEPRVAVPGIFVASASFADDVALVAVSLEEVQFPISGCQARCHLLGIKLNVFKKQIWCNQAPLRGWSR